MPAPPLSWRRQPTPLRRLLISETFSLLAASTAQLSLAWWVGRSGGAGDLSRYAMLLALGSLLALPLLSPLGDRCAKRPLVRLATLGMLAETAALCLLALSGHYRLDWLIALGLLGTTASAVLLPVLSSMLAELVPPAQLPEALRLRRGAQALGSLLGPGLAGGALALGDVGLALSLCLLLAGLSAGAAWRLGSAFQATASARPATGWWQDLRAGLRAKWGVPLDRWWTLSGALMMVFLLPAIGMLLPLRLQALGLSAAWFGACSAALSLGLLAGVMGLAQRLISGLNRVRAIALALPVCGLGMALLGACPWPPGMAMACLLIGLCMSVTQMVGQSHRLLAIPENFRARMSAAQLCVAQLAGLAAPAVAGLLLQHLSVAQAYGGLSLAFLASSLLLLRVPSLGDFLRLDHESVRGWYGRQHPEAFGLSREPGIGHGAIPRGAAGVDLTAHRTMQRPAAHPDGD